MKPQRIAAIGVSVVAFIVYLLTLAPNVVFIDSGELATVAATLGIAHPTGYPLFSLVGYLFTHLPIGGPAIYKANLMAGFFCAVGTGVMTLLIYYILTEWIPRKEKTKQKNKPQKGKPQTAPIVEDVKEENKNILPLIASVAGGLMLAFSLTYWNQATAVEVYSLHCFLVPLALFFFLHYCKEAPEKFYTKWGVLWAVTWGFAFTNHMTTILLIPASVYLFFATFGWNARAFKRGFAMLIPFACVLLLYLYLPIRSAMNPVENWGHPVTWENFLRHWSGKQYQVWMFSSFDAAGKQFKYFMNDFPTQFGLLGLPLFALGVWAAFKANKKIFIFIALLLVTCVLYSINYDIHDIDSYFVLAYMAAGMFCGVGAYYIMHTNIQRQLAIGILAACVLLNLGWHYKEADESHNHMVEDFTLNMLGELPPNAIVLSAEWDFCVSASIYFQHVENIRPDVTVIDKELLRRSWYFNQIKTNYPELYEKSRPQIEAFLVDLKEFENDEPYNPAMIEAHYRAVIESFISQNMASRPVFITTDIEPDYTKGYTRIPEGLLLHLYKNDPYTPVAFPQWKYRDDPERDYYTDKIREIYASMLTLRGQYLMMHKDYTDADKYYDYALTFRPKLNTNEAVVNSNLMRQLQGTAALKEQCEKALGAEQK